MNKNFISIIIIVMALSLCACGSKKSKDSELNAYKESMTEFCNSLESIDKTIKSIDPNDQGSLNQLIAQFDLLESEYQKLSNLPVPKEFSVNESLADEAYDYMVQANDYLKQSFSETSYNPYTLEASMECYKRVNKRLNYIITILHGEMPKDDSISYN